MEKVIKKFNGFDDRERGEINYWKTIDPNVKIEILESIRAMQMEISGEGKQGFQRVLRIFERK